MQVKLKFESNLEYQKDAISSVVDLFDGSPSEPGEFEISLSDTTGALFSELGVGNIVRLNRDAILDNLHRIQVRNSILKSPGLEDKSSAYDFPNFSVEMETGTGKTYVYLRTIFELSQKYGLKKFIIVVPSIAVREGVLSSIRLMRDHFRALYSNLSFDHFVYSSDDLSKVRQFAVSNAVQIMIINIQAFQREAGDVEDFAALSDEEKKKLNVIYQEQDKMSGRRPIDFIRATNPIVIIDEPQSVDNTVKAKRAIKSLKPLMGIRYSATLNDPYNLLYRLDPIRAYELKLVKQIEVASVVAETNFNRAFIRVESIGYAKKSVRPHAKVTIFEDTPSGPKEKTVTLKQESDLSSQTNRVDYEGYIVANISAEEGFERVEFANGVSIERNKEIGGMSDEIAKTQIYQTVEEHLKKEKRFKGLGIKVLSLFFIDRVANYRHYDDEGRIHKGKIAIWFEEAYTELLKKSQYQGVLSFAPSEVHDGYFSVDRKKGKVVALKDTSGSSKDDDETYKLIMQDKERLLSSAEPLRFIFSHSALREGWDNPNIFQICSLREMGAERERRQTLGRGLRLPVNAEGERIFDENINRLTVIASESFEEYASGLQKDIENDVGGGFRFGKLEAVGLAQIFDAKSGHQLGQDRAKELWGALVEKGYLDPSGNLTDKFVPERAGFRLELPKQFEELAPAVTDEMKRYLFKNRIVNARERRSVNFNKRIELNQDFKDLWSKIKQKTRYCVEFKTTDLVELAVAKIKKMPLIQPSKIFVEKTEVDVDEAGVQGGRVLESKASYVGGPERLPDVLAYLQRETELTRATLVEILRQSGRMKEFLINPQAFMSEVAKLTARALNELVVDGIKYEKVDGAAYEMRLFEQSEVEEYLSRLYEVKSQDNRTPYDHIAFDSEVEREVAQSLDSNETVKFFCKLPRWFTIPTPLGSYNPDWAIVTERESKLYLVRETKSTHDRDERRDIENRKIDCGSAHFHAIGVNFKVATNILEVLSE